jgi:asparagine synthase (glutamine-hydrolysing)
MCGIAGVVYAESGRCVDPGVLKRMADSIAHRGPDADGFHIDRNVGLAHRRLSIIDLEGGDQPIGNEDGTIQVVFNGEIYNFRELRSELQSKGHQFRTCSDTEVIVHLYEELGDRCVEKLRGMFAIALWDARKQRLLLARDRVGIKPLFVSVNEKRIVFGSELKPLLAHGDVERQIDPAAIDEYLNYGVIPGNRCIFKGVEKLLPGHVLTVDTGKWQIERRRYWQLNFEADETLSVEDWQAAILAKLDETVRLHLLADVPVGSFLSGGIDSSIVTGLASRALSTPIQTFSMGFRESAFNELPAAREIAEHFGTEHTEQTVSADAVSLLPKLAQFYDEPFADSSAVPTFLVSQIASQHVKVVLSGDGGDEALGGYSRYAHDLKEASIRRLIPRWMQRPLLSTLATAWPKADWLPRPLRLKTFLTNMSLPAGEAYANTLSLCRLPLRHQLLNADLRRSIGNHDPSRVAASGFGNGGTDPLNGMIAADMATLLPDDYLVKVDRASMANGLEVRPPMLDHEFLELCARVPARLKINGGETKWLLRQTARSLVPASIIDRPKQGFEIPVDQWFRGPLGEIFRDTVLASGSSLAGIVHQPTAEQMLDRHCRGTGRHGSTLWSLLTLATWADQYLSDAVQSGVVSSDHSQPPVPVVTGVAS